MILIVLYTLYIILTMYTIEFVCFNGFENEAELFLSDMKNEGVYVTSLADFKFD